MTDCIFCRIASGELAVVKVAENADCVAFRDIAPQAPVHVLVIPRAHYASLEQVQDAARVVGSMAALAQQVARGEGIGAKGYRCVINTGADGGQTVGHLHMHVLGGREHGWPPG
jgi:histidine triad (HIT) family protein